jgi:hypothetical protein
MPQNRDMRQTALLPLRRRHAVDFFALKYSYCNSIQNHIPYYKFIARHCALYTHMQKCIQMLLILNCLFSHWNKIFRAWKSPMDVLPTVFSCEGEYV